jgi:uncharacterized protein involved in exopolysaccharide biosynthesis
VSSNATIWQRRLFWLIAALVAALVLGAVLVYLASASLTG